MHVFRRSLVELSSSGNNNNNKGTGTCYRLLIFTDMQVQRPIQPIAIVTSEDHNIDITTHRLTDNHSMLAWLFSLLAP